MDVYRPRNATRALPTVLFVHGTTGADSPKDWGQYVGWGQLAAASGLAGVTFNHEEDVADIAAAIRYVRANGPRLGIDGKRLCVAGYSAGVHPALLTALDGSVGRLRCAVAYYGFLDAELSQVSSVAQLRAGRLPIRWQGGTRQRRAERVDRPLHGQVAKVMRRSNCDFMRPCRGSRHAAGCPPARDHAADAGVPAPRPSPELVTAGLGRPGTRR